MLNRRTALLQFTAGLLPRLASGQGVAREPPKRKPNVVLVSGETENQSERSLGQLTQELESRHGVRCTMLAISGPADMGLEALEDAQLAVFYVSSLALPKEQLEHIKTYAASGRPVVALRTSTRGFQNWPEFGHEVLGAGWQFDYGPESSTDVSVFPAAAGHPILKDIPAEFHCRSPLYHVLPLAKSARPLLMGKSVGPSPRAQQVPNPVAWTNTYKRARVFYTSLGHSEDFQVQPFRMLLINGIHWALAS